MTGLVGQANTSQAQIGLSKSDLDRLVQLKPTLEEILAVDEKDMPWGVNLCLVDKRGKTARDKSLDQYDFSSRITLFQKHKSQAQVHSKKYADLVEQKASLSPIKRLNTKKIDEEIEAVSKKLNDNRDLMKKFMETIQNKTGLSVEQINALPDLTTWKEMKKTACTQDAKLLPARPRNMAPPPPPRGGPPKYPPPPLPTLPTQAG